jgi:CysZ protein
MFKQSLNLTMRFFKNLLIGLRAYFKAIRFIREHKLYWYILIPAVLMLGIYKIGEHIQQKAVHVEVTNMNEIIWFLIHMMIEISIALLLMNFAKYLVVILLSPLLAHLSEKTERILTGNTYPFNFQQLFHDVRRGIRIAVRNLIWQYFFFLIIFLVSAIGWKEPEKAPVFYLIYAIAFYYYGFSFIDYVNERRKLNMDESIHFVRQNRGLAVAIGMIYSILILMPVDLSVIFSFSSFKNESFLVGIGGFFLHLLLWIFAATAPILAIVSATIAMNDIVDLKKR